MKTFSLVVLSLFVFFRAAAQVSVEVTLDQDQFLPSESIPVAVKIINRSGQQLHLGDTPFWLTFSVESADGFIVIKNDEVPVAGEFDLESSQLAIKRADLQPHFVVSRPGRYKIIATLRVKGWATAISSAPKIFDVIRGAELWAQDFGVPNATNGVPEVRKFTLVEANYLKSQLRLYVQVSDPAQAQIFRVSPLGQLVSFSQPEAKVDRLSQLHVLWQAGAQAFDYSIVTPNGKILRSEIYDTFNSHPRLGVNEAGEVVVIGGVRRMKPQEAPVMPMVKAPNELPAKLEPEKTSKEF